uniref:Uncharacterized protein n=1 Tax=Anguilla anguilla TaxID=7936 RepID=A0A0E9U6W9_ANGAN
MVCYSVIPAAISI